MINPSAGTITAYYPLAMGLLLGDVHLSELERLNKPCASVGRELTTPSTQPSHHHTNTTGILPL